MMIKVYFRTGCRSVSFQSRKRIMQILAKSEKYFISVHMLRRLSGFLLENVVFTPLNSS